MAKRQSGEGKQDADARRVALVAYSEARASRRDVSDAFGAELSFGDLLTLLGAEGLNLPLYQSDSNSPGRVLLRHFLSGRQADVGR